MMTSRNSTRGRTEHPVDAYARAVVTGEVPAGKYHRLACERHLRDRDREHTPAFPYRFDAARADRFLRFAAKLKHYKGEWSGQRIVLEGHQVFRHGSFFGWRHVDTGFRRFRTSYNEIPRKNGKTLEAGVVLDYATFFDGEPGAEGYCVATKRQQAKLAFDAAKRLVRSSGLRRRIRVLANNLSSEATASKAEPLGADYDSTDGLNPQVIIVDEFHAHKNRGLIDVLETATGARRQPVNFQITTAGSDPMSPCGDQHDYAVKILEQVLSDETFFAFIAHADEGDDWLSEHTWRKANPNYGVSVKPDDLRALATKARHMPSAANAFKQKRLNLWVSAASPWLSLEGWRAGDKHGAPPATLEGRECFGALDLSSKTDLTALVLTFPPLEGDAIWWYLLWALTPEDTLKDRALRDRAPYLQWVADSVLRTNPGKRIDHKVVRALVNEVGDRYDIQELGLDPWNAGNLPTDLDDDGYVVTEIPQTISQLSGPAKEFEADVLQGHVATGGNPLFAWSASNVVVLRDSKDNIFPNKKKSRGRIDPIVAAIMARKMAGQPPDEESTSAYGDHDLVVV